MPAGTPQIIITKVNAAVNAVLQMPDVASSFETVGLFPVGGEPERLAQLLKSDSDRWADIIREANITVP